MTNERASDRNERRIDSRARRASWLSALAVIAVVLALTLLPLNARGVDAKPIDSTIGTTIDTSLPPPETPTPTETPTPDTGVADPVIDLGDPVLIDGGDLTPVVDPAPATIYVTKYACPSSYDGDYNQLAANCEGADAPFAVTDSLANEQDFGGSFTASVASGDTVIQETVPDGFAEPIVFCAFYDAELNETPAAGQYVETGAILVSLGAGESVYCDWFNVPTSDDGTIYINKHACPAGFDAVAATVYDLAAACNLSGNGFQFSLLAGETLIDQQTTGDVIDQAAQFDGLAASSYTVAETIAPGYSTPRVFCTLHDVVGDEGTNFEADVLDGQAIEGELGDGQYLFCDWFNIPTDDGSVVIHKWNCPAGTEATGLSHDDYLTACTDAMDGIDFTLTQGDVVDVENTGANGTPGEADFTTQPGDATIAETIPSGYSDPVVFCGWGAITDLGGGPIAIDGIVQPDGVVGGVLEHSFYAGEGMSCDWFNIPSDDGWITIYKYTCPIGYDLSATDANPQADCTDLTDGIAFTLSPATEGAVSTTGDAGPGAGAWKLTEDGAYTITETLPSSTVQTWVSCQWIDDAGAYSYAQIVPYATTSVIGDTIGLDAARSDRIVCQWYNAPRRDGGDLTVIKYWCDGAVYTTEACQLYGGGADFSLASTSGGDPILFSTGGDGTATLHLPASSWALTESGRPWCRAESADLDASGDVVTSDGHESVVTVFNCGPGKKKEPPVKRFPNTGAGTTVSSASHGFPALASLLALSIVAALASAVLIARERLDLWPSALPGN